MTQTIHNVTVLGSGVLGSQIAFQAAFHGFAVTVYDINDEILADARKRFGALAEVYATQAPTPEGVDGKAAADQALAGLRYSSDLADAAKDTDLVIEAIPEILDLKRKVFGNLNDVAPSSTIFATNSSTLLPSDIADATGRPDRFLALHFANEVWLHNTAEIMGTEQTDPEVFDTIVDFATKIGAVPIPMHKEKAGYVLNSLLVPFLTAALELAADGYAEPHDVDKVWSIATGAPLGPFRIFDIVGLHTPYNIMANGTDLERRLAQWLKDNYIDQGKLGRASGEGFYTYPQN